MLATLLPKTFPSVSLGVIYFQTFKHFFPLIHTRTYVGLKNISFTEVFAYVLKEWSLKKLFSKMLGATFPNVLWYGCPEKSTTRWLKTFKRKFQQLQVTYILFKCYKVSLILASFLILSCFSSALFPEVKGVSKEISCMKWVKDGFF